MHFCYICRRLAAMNFEGTLWCKSCHSVRTRYPYNPAIYSRGYAEHYHGLTGTEIEKRLNASRAGIVKTYCQPGASVMDVGCGVADFLASLGDSYRRIGVEPNQYARRYALEKVPNVGPVLDGHAGLNAITLFDVVEHLESPYAALHSMIGRLHSDGVLVLTTPNVDVIPFGEFEELKSWKHWKPREHLFLYGQQGLMEIASFLRLKVVKMSYEESSIRPGNEERGILTAVLKRSECRP